MPLVFEVVFSIAVISQIRIESIGDGWVGGVVVGGRGCGGWEGLWWVGSRRRAKANIQTQQAVLCHQ